MSHSVGFKGGVEMLTLPSVLFRNVWDPSQQPQTINEIGKHYSFSPRLVGSLVVRYPESSHDSSTFPSVKERHRNRASVPPPPPKSDELDLEARSNGIAFMGMRPSMPNDVGLEETMALQLIHGILNYTSIDQGEKCTYLGTEIVMLCNAFRLTRESSYVHGSKLAT